MNAQRASLANASGAFCRGPPALPTLLGVPPRRRPPAPARGDTAKTPILGYQPYQSLNDQVDFKIYFCSPIDMGREVSDTAPMAVAELELRPRINGRVKAPVEAVFVRELRAEDLQLLAQPRGTKPRLIVKLRDRHHQLARCLAQGMSDWEASAVTGYDPARISVLKGDPTFSELLAFYREKEDSLLGEFTQRATVLTLTAMENLQEVLENEDEPASPQFNLEVAKTFADRTGNAPVNRSVVATASVELGARLAAARARLTSARPDPTAIDADFTVVSAPPE